MQKRTVSMQSETGGVEAAYRLATKMSGLVARQHVTCAGVFARNMSRFSLPFSRLSVI